MWLLEWPGPALHAIDGLFASLPACLRVVIWGAACGVLSIGLYGMISPQQRIARLKSEQLAARRQLDRFDGEFAQAWLLIRRLLILSFSLVGRVAAPALAASMPVLFVLVWMPAAYASTQCLSSGPWWIRGWEAGFFMSLITATLVLKRLLRIH